MDKTSQSSDIVKEEYQGPSASVEAAGRGFFEHFVYAAIGLAVGGVFAFLAHKPAASFIHRCRTLGSELKETKVIGDRLTDKLVGKMKNGFGSFLHGVFGDSDLAQLVRETEKIPHPKHTEWLENTATDKERGFGNAFLSHTIGIVPFIGRPFKKMLREFGERSANAITLGGALGAFGYVAGWVKAVVAGSINGNPGKQQFTRAQREIAHLREVNSDLERVNDSLHEKYVAAASQRGVADQPEEKNGDAMSESAPDVGGVGQGAHHASHIAKDAAPSHHAPTPHTHTNHHQGMMAAGPEQEVVHA